MNRFKHVRLVRAWAVASAAACLMAACGGGNDNNDGGNLAKPDAGPTVELSGVASKGLMKQALVKVFRVTEDGRLGAQLGQTLRTGNDGRYAITGLPASTWVYVEVSADENTRMADEATHTDLAVPAGFKLRGMQKLSGQGSSVLQVTPFSDMAVAMALTQGGTLKPEVIDAANRKVVAYFNLPVLSEEPRFDAAGAPLNPSAVSLAGVSRLAHDDVLAACKSAVGQAAKVACVVAQIGMAGTSDTAMTGNLERARSLAQSGYVGAVVPRLVTQLPTDGMAPALDGIAEAKALIQSIRDNTGADVTGSVMERVNDVADEIRQTPVYGMSALGDALGVIGKSVAVLQDPQRELGDFKGPTFGPELSYGRGAACTLYADARGDQPARSHAEAKAVGCVIELGEYMGGSGSTSTDGSSQSTHQLYDLIVWTTLSAVKDQYVVETLLHTQEVTVSQGPSIFDASSQMWVPGAMQTVLAPGMVVPDSQRRAQAKLEAGSAGQPFGSLRLMGNLMPAWPQQEDDVLYVDLQLKASVATSALTRLDAMGQALYFSAGEQQVGVFLRAGSHVMVPTRVPGDVTTAHNSNLADSVLQMQAMLVFSSGAHFDGQIDIGDVADDAKRKGPRYWHFLGALLDKQDIDVFRGEITLRTPADAAPPTSSQARTRLPGAQLDLAGVLPFPDRPAMQVFLSIGESAASGAPVSFAGSYRQGADVVMLNGTYDDLRAKVVSLRVATPSDVAMGGLATDETFDIRKGSELLGRFFRRAGRVEYADGTYEQF